MNAYELPAMTLVGLSAALACLALAATSCAAATERETAPATRRPVPPMDAEAPTATQTAIFATG